MGRPAHLRLTTRRSGQEPADLDMHIVKALSIPALPETKTRVPRIDLGELRVALGAGSLRFAICLLDRSGRLAQRPLLQHLGWEPGDRLGLVLGGACAQLVRDPDGVVSVDPRMRLALPAAALHYCRLGAGDQALMIGMADHDCLVVHSMSTLAHMVRTHHADLAVRRRSGVR